MKPIFVAFFILFFLIATFLMNKKDGRLHLVFCDVGQGEAIYISFPNGQDGLIDGGPDNQVLSCLGNNMAFWDRKIDFVILTHGQADHLTGLIEVVKRYHINIFFNTSKDAESKIYQKLIESLQQKGVIVKNLYQGDHFEAGNTSLKVLWPVRQFLSQDLNDYSTVILLDYVQFQALFTGDLSLDHLQAAQKIEVLKVPHHGAASSLEKADLSLWQPKIAVISAGKNNRYGHPSELTLGLLKKAAVRILRTDIDGEVEVTSDGRQFSVL